MQRKNLSDLFTVEKNSSDYVICLAGNPNTGKSSLFNELTRLKQHTGNWPGKTVVNARGKYEYDGKSFILVDVPGTYSLYGLSEEEIVARDFICFGNADLTIVVTDATSIERNLNLVFQVMEVSHNVIMVINLIDEARKKGIKLNPLGFEYRLGIPVIVTSTKTKEGIERLKKVIASQCNEKQSKEKIEASLTNLISYPSEIEAKLKDLMAQGFTRFEALRLLDASVDYIEALKKYSPDLYQKFEPHLDYSNQEELREEIISTNYQVAEKLVTSYVQEEKDKLAKDKKIDDIITSRRFGIPLMLILLSLIFYLTIKAANYPSQLLYDALFWVEGVLLQFFVSIHVPTQIMNFLVLGVYRTVAWVTAVMLPPMSIFFPLFTLLEDLGFLPRIAFNLDHQFKRVCAHGKQSLTMCMGFGCNAVGVTGTRIIDSPREKLIAILTNTFVPCNGRFPTIIAIAGACFAITSSVILNQFIPVMVTLFMIIIGVIITLIVSYFLSKTILKGEASTFTLELPPYRKPKIFRTLYTSLIDRTVFLLGRALKVAAPFGGLIWLLGNVDIGNHTVLQTLANFFDPFARLLGLDGIILLGFILALPANEIVLPVILMGYLTTGHLTDFESLDSLRSLFQAQGWTLITGINFLLFSLLHWPCSTTLLTIKKETNSWKWTLLAFLLPTTLAILTCLVTNTIYQLLI